MKKVLTLILACLAVVSLCLLPVSAQKDIAQSISLPAALIQGHTYHLQHADTKLLVNGESCEDGFVAQGSQAELVYTDAQGAEIASYTLPVIDTKASDDQPAYFYDPAGRVSIQENENNLALSFSRDTQVSFLNKLNSEDFALYLSFVEEATRFQKVTVKLTDAQDATVSLTFSIDVASLSVSQQDNAAQLEDLSDVVQLRYKNASQKLMLGSEQVLFACEKDDSDAEFSGFAGGVYLTLGFEGVTGASTLNLTRVNNQALGHKNSTLPDMAEPALAITSELQTTQKMGQQFDIPSYAVYDVLSQVTESSVTVEAPDGTTYTEPFTISQYGKYKVTFFAKDSYNNQMKTVKMVFVNDDVAPQLTVSAMEKTEYSVGDSVKVPAYTASDNLNSCMVDVILFLPNAEIRLLSHDVGGQVQYSLADASLYNSSFMVDNSSFRAEQAGTYTIRYVAYDDQYNRVVQELTFTVAQ